MQKSRTQWECRRSGRVFALTVVCVLEDSSCRGSSHLGCAGIKHIDCGQFPALNYLVGLVVKVSASRAKDPGYESCWWRDFSGSSHTSDLNIGTPVAALPEAWRSRVSAGTGQPGVSILRLGEVESWICSFYLSVAACKIVWADPSLRCTSLLLGR